MSGQGPASIGQDSAWFNFLTGQTAVTTAATKIVDMDAIHRSKLYLVNTTTDTDVYISSQSSVSSTNGFLLPPRVPMWLPVCGDLYGITSSGTADVSYGEVK